MDHQEVGHYWNQNADTWTALTRQGYDIWRDHINTPAFLEMLPDVKDLKGLDIGCGEGHNTRKVAERGAKMSAIDISDVFIKHAIEVEKESPLDIHYSVASAVDLPYENESFDFVMATMSFMDIPETEKVIQQAHRVLKPGGFLQFSILHPCFHTPKWDWIFDDNGNRIAIQCGDYFRELKGGIDEWMFSSIPESVKKTTATFKVPYFYTTLSNWLNLLIKTGFVLEHFAEPKANEDAIKKLPNLAGSEVIAFFLIIRSRKS